MKRSIKAAISLCILAGLSVQAEAAVPIPTFDKEAVTEHPYNRTGDQDYISDKTKIEGELYKPGNTGTAEEPAFFVSRIELTGYALPEDKDGRRAEILSRYEGRSIKVSELDALTAELTEYCRTEGFTVPQAIIPAQEVRDGVLQIKIYVSTYDTINITENTTEVADRVLQRFLQPLEAGSVMTDKQFEIAMNNLNDLPGVEARAVLSPGSEPGSTKVDIEALRRPVWNNYVFIDNGGGYYSGRYRYGFNTEINNPGHQGDKFIISGMMSSHDMKSYSLRYEAPVGSRGTRLGIAYSQSSYELHTNGFYNSLGKSRGISVYGMSPIYRDRMNRVTAIYGYDHRDIKDELRFKSMSLNIRTDKDADVFHIGISGSQYYPNQFTQYDLIYWYGNMDTKNQQAYYDGDYHKLTGDLLKIWYDNKFNYRIDSSFQLANRPLDGSEQFFLGGMNGVRAYGSGDGYGDNAYFMTGEVRVKTDEPGLEVAAFIDWGGAKDKQRDKWDHLAGWGLGLRYAKDNEWYAQLDWSKKINGRPDYSEPKDHDGRWWFQVYKMF